MRLNDLVALTTKGVIGLLVFSFIVNLLLLVQPLYMLQIYDRVLTSGSFDTLLFISLLAAGALLLLGLLDAIRAIIASRVAARIEVEVGESALLAAMNAPKASLGDVQPLRDLATVRNFIGGRAIFAWLDLPFAPFFIVILYLIHPHLFWMTLIGALVLGALALANERATAKVGAEASEKTMSAQLVAQSLVRNAETLGAMGMVRNAVGVWGQNAAGSMIALDRMNRRNALFAGISRILRMGLQLAILGYGGYLVINGEMTAGMIFASSLISGRALQPIDQVIAGWRGVTETRRAWQRLKQALSYYENARAFTQLPPLQGALQIDKLIVFPPNVKGANPLLKGVSLDIAAGDCLVIIGPSGAGKSTLARAIVGALKPANGSISVDGADIRNIDPDQFGAHVGYLAQDVELLPGTVSQNIARFDPRKRDDEVITAARKAQVHDLVNSLPSGYDTTLGPGGLQLSGGQRQRIGLARAFFGSPRLVVLDEPNSHLDAEGEQALERAIRSVKADGVTVVVVTQRRGILELADKIAILKEGGLQDFGTKQDVMARQAKAQSARQAAPAPAMRPANTPDSQPSGQPASTMQPVAVRFSPVMTAGLQKLYDS